jgi:lipopolysaccharide export LptBFGC system permease protein LptF
MVQKQEEKMPPKDYDKDGYITEEEITLQIKLEKAEAQAKIARVALVAIIILISYILSPWGPDDARILVLDGIIQTTLYALASIVGVYMGVTAWMSKK